ncbi:prostasin [Culex quinquefasciatus]|uniref:prostasin n=1 Tax=Culex quinquefasciatus TaxID=7176 RepID=UPI0018E2C891|nr:prostasin [Culex quinquefasciatus]
MKPSWMLLVVGITVQFTNAKEYAEWGRSEGTEGFSIGGEQVINPSLYPWHVAIFVQGKYGGGGSLISDSFVLTATHVVYNFATESLVSPKSISVKAGIVKLGDASAKVFSVAEIAAYPDFDYASLDNDICLLKLETKVKFGASIRPINLWDEADRDVSMLVSKQYSGQVVGWGLVEGGGKTNNLNRVEMNFLDAESCQKGVPAFKRNDFPKKDKSYCAIRENQTVCSGDSGGGMFLYDSNRKAYYLRGFVSQGVTAGRGCEANVPVLFTDIAFYLKWIEQTALPRCYNLLGYGECPMFGMDENKYKLPLGIAHLNYKFRRNLLISDCHGVLISKKHVLTQASCVEPNQLRELQSITIGNIFINDYSGSVAKYEINSVNTNAELAILALNRDVSQQISPICLPTAHETGSPTIFFWTRRSPHPKKIQQVHIDAFKMGDKSSHIFQVPLPGNQTRLGGTPLLYSIADSHMFLRALEKCPWKGCVQQETAQFVDVLLYGGWIRDVVGAKSGEDELLPPRCAV